MAVMSVIKLSESYRNKRVDPDFYKPEYLVVESTLIKKPNKRLLKQSKKINCGPFGSTLMCETYITEGIPIIRPFNLIDMKIEGEIVYIPKEDIAKKGLKLFDSGDICFSRVGDVKFGIIYGFKDSVTISPNIIAVKLHKGQLNPYFLIAFLNTKYGYKQLERGLKVVAQPTVNTADIGKIIVPQFDNGFQKIIEKIILNAFNLYDQSKSLYPQAETLLLEELGLKDFKPKYDLSYIANLSDAFGVHRVDAEYFQPAYEKIIQKVSKKIQLRKLKEIFDFRRGVFIPTDYYTEEKTDRPYIRIKELSGKIGIDENKVIFINAEYPEDIDNKLLENDLVIAIIGDTIGKVNRITKELSGGFCSNNTGRLRIKEQWRSKILTEYAELIFQSLFIQSQIERKKAQTGQPKISDLEIKNILIPVLPDKTQQKIASLVQQSHEARKKAKELLGEAKRKVEEAIEKDK